MKRLKALKLAVIGVGALLVLSFVGVLAIDFWVRSTLKGHGFDYASVDRNGLDWRINKLTYPSLSAQQVRIRLGTTPRFEMRAAVINVAKLDAEPLPSVPSWLYVSGDPVTLTWGKRVLASGLRTRVDDGLLVATGPSLRMRGPYSSAGAALDIDGDFSFDWIAFKTKAQLTLASPARLSAKLPTIRVTSADLGKEPLVLTDAIVEVEGVSTSAKGAFNLSGTKGSLELSCAGTGGGPCKLRFAIDEGDLGGLFSQLKSLTPKQSKAKVKGALKLRGDIDFEQSRANAAVALSGASVKGGGIKTRQYGEFFYYKAPTANGKLEEIESGPESASWTALEDMAPALLAAVEVGALRLAHPNQAFKLGDLAITLVPDKSAPSVPSVYARHLVNRLLIAENTPAAARALQETLLATELEAALGAESTRALYLNIVNWAPGVHGVQAAAEHFFEAKPDELDARQAAFLIALLPDPLRAYDAWYTRGKPDREQLEAFIKAMGESGGISQDEASEALTARLAFE